MSDKDNQAPPPAVWGPTVLLAWAVPGGGHFLQKRYGRAGLLAFSIITMFVFGLMMRGQFLKPQGGDLLNILIYYGGFICNLASGLPYLLSSWLGYSQPDVAGAVYDYGTKFLVTAGLLNVLAIIDAFEIASGRKN